MDDDGKARSQPGLKLAEENWEDRGRSGRGRARGDEDAVAEMRAWAVERGGGKVRLRRTDRRSWRS